MFAVSICNRSAATYKAVGYKFYFKRRTMKLKFSTTIFLAASFFVSAAQEEITASAKRLPEATTPVAQPEKSVQEVVLITGVRFAYPLVQKWIDDYARVNENVQIIVESRGVQDPAKYDILI